MSPKIAILLLAAGASTRMGEDKLVRRLPSGRTLLEDRLTMVCATDLSVYVVVPCSNATRIALCEGFAVSVLKISEATGLGKSIAFGTRALHDECDGIMVVLADMPAITSNDIATLVSHFDGNSIVRGCEKNGAQGHPVLFPAKYRSALATLKGDTGARTLIDAEEQTCIALPTGHATFDLDNPDDWDAWVKSDT